jgi:hypothetical protein
MLGYEGKISRVAARRQPIFTPEEREAATERLVAGLAPVEGVDGVVPLGSIADGSADRHSDVDLAVVLAPNAKAAAVAADCTQVVLAELPVFHYFSQSLGGIEFRGFLLESFLEIDLGFARAHEVEAATAVPSFDAAAKLDYVWHDVIHAAVALDRGRPWRALWYVERLRNGALEIAGGRLGLDLRHFKDVDQLAPETLAAAEAAIAAGPTEREIWPALRAATSALFAEGRRTKPELSDKLEPKLGRFLDLLEHNRSGRQ